MTLLLFDWSSCFRFFMTFWCVDYSVILMFILFGCKRS